MGYTSYSTESRTNRATLNNYSTGSINTLFTQQKECKAHVSMLPKDIVNRECRDSDTHPISIPIIIALDVTGSMLDIPHQLLVDGLPKIVSNIIEKSNIDPSILFIAVGDHITDSYPLQVGQFESGDLELDTWLTRTYLEGKGGGNQGESYPLVWYFAGNHTISDHFEKRNQKGFLFTIGDEPFLNSFSKNSMEEIMGNTYKYNENKTAEDFLRDAQEKYHVFHIFVEHNHRLINKEWKELLQENLIKVYTKNQIPDTIINTIINFSKSDNQIVDNSTKNYNNKIKPDNKITL